MWLRVFFLYVFIYLRKLIDLPFTLFVKTKFWAKVIVILKLIFYFFVLTNFDIADNDVSWFLLLAHLTLKVVRYTRIGNGILGRCQNTIFGHGVARLPIFRRTITTAHLMLLDDLVDLLLAYDVVDILAVFLYFLVYHHHNFLSVWAYLPFALPLWAHVVWAEGVYWLLGTAKGWFVVPLHLMSAQIICLHPSIVVTHRKHWTCVRSESADVWLLNTWLLGIVSHTRKTQIVLLIRQELASMQKLYLPRVLQRRHNTLYVLVVFFHDHLGDVTAP